MYIPYHKGVGDDKRDLFRGEIISVESVCDERPEYCVKSFHNI